MPNYCNFEMKVRGEKENIETLYKWLSANYNYTEENTGLKCWTIKNGVNKWGEIKEEDKIPCEHHIGYRVFECDCEDEIDDDYTFMYGYCAWSVYSCMFQGDGGTYMGDVEKDNKERFAISLVDACRELELEVELFSEEPGCAFSEHYYIDKGELVCDDEAEFIELYLEYYDKNSDEFDEESYNSLDDNLKGLVEESIANGLDWLKICDHIDEDDCWNWEYI